MTSGFVSILRQAQDIASSTNLRGTQHLVLVISFLPLPVPSPLVGEGEGSRVLYDTGFAEDERVSTRSALGFGMMEQAALGSSLRDLEREDTKRRA